MLKREKEIKIRFTEPELTLLNKKCRENNLKREEYVREIIANNLDKKYVSREEIIEEIKQLIFKINAVGNDINNIARQAHLGGQMPDDVIEQIINMQRIIFDELRRFKGVK